MIRKGKDWVRVYLEMEYGYEMGKEKKVLAEGEFKKYPFKIISYGTHPCAYIGLTKKSRFYREKYENIDLPVHGGLTFGGTLPWLDRGFYWIGWDYSHLYDFTGIHLNPALTKYSEYFIKNKKRWTVKEMLQEVEEAIRKLDRMEKNKERKK